MEIVDIVIIIKSGLIEVLNYNLTTRIEFSSDVAYSNRQTIIPNNSKLLKSSSFLNIVIKRFKRMKGLESIETIINSLKVNNKDLIKSMETILEDLESDKLVSNIGQMFDVQFPIDDKRNMEMREGIESPWKKNDVPF